MTVCVGAICSDGEIAVVASDRMVTTSMPPIEFEHTKKKIFDLTENCVVLAAGNALLPVEVIPKLKSILSKTASIPQIADQAKELYQVLRSNRTEELFLKPRSISKEVFYTRGASLFPPDLFRIIDQNISNFNFNCDLMIAGVDSEAHIYGITNPGIANCYDTIGFHAIGIGYLHAIQTFIAHNYKTSYSMEEAINIVYAAKKAAETAPGVGQETDICIIFEDQIVHVSKDIIEEVKNIYDDVTGSPIDEIKQKSDQLSELIEKRKKAQEEANHESNGKENKQESPDT